MRQPLSLSRLAAAACSAGLPTALVLLSGCSSGGATGGDGTQGPTCSAVKPCPAGLACALDRGVCEPPAGSDLGTGGPDMGATDHRSCLTASWCWENPLPQPSDLHAVWGSSASDVWAAGLYGTVVHYDGTTWRQVPSGTTVNLTGLWGRSASQMWAVGDKGTILYWDGTRFAPQPSGVTLGLSRVWGGGGTVWAVGANGTLLKGDGTSWQSVTLPISSTLFDVWGSDGNDIWVLAQSGTTCHYGGTSWTCHQDFSTGTPTTLVGLGKNDLWALSRDGQAWHFTGAAWEYKSLPAINVWRAYVLAPGNALAVGSAGKVLAWDGTSWRAPSFNVAGAPDLYDVWGSDPAHTFVVGDHGTLLRYDGTNVKAMNTGFAGTEVRALWGTADHDVWAFTADGHARHFDGSSWTDSTLPSVGYAAAGRAGNDLWVGTDSGRVLRYDGSKWTAVVTSDTKYPITGVFIAAPDRVVTVSASSVQFWDGTRFTVAYSPPLSHYLFSVWGSGPNDLWVGGDSCTYYHYYKDTSWTTGTLPGCSGAILSIHGTGPSDVYLAEDTTSQIYHYDGTRVTAIATGGAGSGHVVMSTPTKTFFGTYGGEIFTGSGTTFTSTVKTSGGISTFANLGGSRVWAGGEGGNILSYWP
jgi:hypothetical protein